MLPDLLSQIGLNVYSRPGRGTRQDGVDVAAVGNLDGGNEKVYLFSIKAGDLTRSSWDGNAVQSLRPSLNEILDTYIPNRLPNEHKDKDVVICLCFGGDIQEQVRPQVEGYIKQNERNNLTFEEWNGDKLASLILANFLREDLLPQQARSQLRKSLALLDEPEASYQHFSALIRSLSSIESTKDKDQLTAIRQIIICLWILFSWSRDANNIESAYLSSELALLYSWEIAKRYFAKTTKAAKEVQLAFQSILIVYQQINSQYLGEKVLPHTHKRHALSVAVQSSCNLDVNLKMFDVLSRLAIGGIWAYRGTQRIGEDEVEIFEKMWEEVQSFSNTDHVGDIVFSLRKAAHVYDDLPDPQEAADTVRSAMYNRGPFLFNGELDTVQFYFTGTLALNVPEGIADEITFLREMRVPEETWRSQVEQNRSLSPRERDALSRIYSPSLSEAEAEILQAPDTRWGELVPILKRHADDGLARSIEFKKSCYLSAVRLFEECNTGICTYVNFLYFSLVTITTLGYGDILPNDPIIRAVVMIEVVLGLGIIVFFVSAIGTRRKAQQLKD